MREEGQVKRVVGLDAHPYMFSLAAVAGPDALQAKVEWVVDRHPLERLEAIIKARVGVDDVVVLEAGSNSFSVVERIQRCGRKAIILESQSVGKVGKAYCATDKVDAVKIARVYMSGLAHTVWTPDAQAAAKRELFFAYRNAVRDSVRCRNRIWAWCTEHGLRRPRDLKLTQESALGKLLGLKKDWSPLQRHLLADQVASLQHAEERRQKLHALIAEGVATDPEALKLMRLLGIRCVIAFALTAFIGTIDRFANAKKLVAYFGLNPTVNCSGISGGNGGLSHYGRSDIRALLIQAAQSILRYGQDRTHKWALALKMRRGATIAVAALARKLVVAVWYLMKNMFTPLVEVPTTLKIKIKKLAVDIGAKRIRELGYKSLRAMETKMMEVYLQTS